MFIKFNTEPILARLVEDGGQYFILSETSNAFRDFDWVTVQVWWDSVNSSDGLITMNERLQDRIPVWSSVPNQYQALDRAEGSRIFHDYDLRCQEVSIWINRGTATTGNFYWAVMGSKQHSGVDIVREIKNLNDSIKSLTSAIYSIK